MATIYGTYFNDNGTFNGDKVQLKGSRSDYTFKTTQWTGGSALDTSIYYKGDIIGLALDVTLTQSDYKFV